MIAVLGLEPNLEQLALVSYASSSRLLLGFLPLSQNIRSASPRQDDFLTERGIGAKRPTWRSRVRRSAGPPEACAALAAKI